MTKPSKEIKQKNEETTILFKLDKEYKTFLNDLKNKIQSTRLKAALAVNHEVVALYWHIGGQIIEKQKITHWGDKLLEALSSDLRYSFPETRGFSPTRLKRMRMFAACYPRLEFGSQPVTQLPWGHIQLLLFKIKDKKIQAWYAAQCLENGWSRSTLEKYIKNDLFTAQGCKANKATNFLARLPAPQSSLAQDMIKNPYNFDFLGLIHDSRIEKHFVDKAKQLRSVLLHTTQHEYLCHGDLHLENIIQQGSNWLVIDPKGIVGEMAFEASAYDLISKDEMKDVFTLLSKIIDRVTQLSQALEISFNRLLSWIFLRIITSAQWFIEDDGDPSQMLALANYIYPLLDNRSES